MDIKALVVHEKDGPYVLENVELDEPKEGTCEGEADPKTFIPQMVSWYKQGIFPVDKILSFYDFSQIDQALADSHDGKIIKAVLRVSEQ